MLRKITIMSAAAFALAAVALAPTSASAGHWGHGHHRHHVRPFVGHYVVHPHVRCWRWVLTRFGYRKVWVCG
jgi:hypothetical protein